MQWKISKAKLKSYNGKIYTNFHNNKISRGSVQFIGLSVILIDSVFRAGENYHNHYPRMFLEECKYIVKSWWRKF